MKLSLTRVQTWTSACDLRIVRNECKDFMTHNQEEITLTQQRRFWMEHLTALDPIFEAYVFYNEDIPIGYGMLKRDGDKYWLTAGLVATARGHGLGRMLIGMMTELAYQDGRTPWIEVLESNKAALIPDIKTGYRLENIQNSPRGTLYIMKHRHDRGLDDADTQRLLQL